MLVIVSGFAPFERVKVDGGLDDPTLMDPKFWVVGLRLAVDPPELVPVPVNVALCGLFDALSLTVSVPVSVPVAAGLKVTVIVHEVFAARVCGEIGQLEVGE